MEGSGHGIILKNEPNTVTPLSVIPTCTVSPNYCSLLLVPKIAHIKSITMSDAVFLEVSFYRINFSQFLVLNHSTPRTIILEKINSEKNVMFLGSKVVVTFPH